jgi:hypothetical protein
MPIKIKIECWPHPDIIIIFLFIIVINHGNVLDNRVLFLFLLTGDVIDIIVFFNLCGLIFFCRVILRFFLGFTILLIIGFLLCKDWYGK